MSIINVLDAIVIGVTLISAVLATVRGATREVLAIVSWFVAGAAAYFFYPSVIPMVKNYVSTEILALVIAAAGVFLVTLLIVSFITVKISDMVLDSRIGAVDRTLGFIFGVLRGFLLCICGWAVLTWILSGQTPEMVKEAKTLPMLESSATTLKNALPENVIKWAQEHLPNIREKSDSGSDAPADSENAPQATDRPANNP